LHLPTNKHPTWLMVMLLALTVSPLPGLANSMQQHALQLLEQGHIPEARRALQSELVLHPRNIEARYDLAVLLEDIGHHADALNLYKKNLSISWHLPSLINLAAGLQQQGKTERARQWLEQATRKIRHEAVPWYLLADLSEQASHNATATAQHQHAIKADPLNGFAWLRFAAFQSRHQQADHGLHHARKAIRLLPNCAPCWRIYGNILHRSGDHHAALNAYQRSLAIHPDNTTRQQLITTLRQLGQTERAQRMQEALNAWRKHHK